MCFTRLWQMGTKEFEWERLPVAKDIKPPPRWRHSANLVENRLIVFGGFHSTMERFNDVWVRGKGAWPSAGGAAG